MKRVDRDVLKFLAELKSNKAFDGGTLGKGLTPSGIAPVGGSSNYIV